jgi:hypothetical protein
MSWGVIETESTGRTGTDRQYTPDWAGESNIRAHQTAVAGHPGMDSSRRRGARCQPVRPACQIRQAGRDSPRRRLHTRPRFRLRPRITNPQKPAAGNSLTQRSGRPCLLPPLRRMNLATTESHPWKSGVRSSTGSLLHPLSTPRSPTPIRVLTVHGAAGAKAIS